MYWERTGTGHRPSPYGPRFYRTATRRTPNGSHDSLAYDTSETYYSAPPATGGETHQEWARPAPTPSRRDTGARARRGPPYTTGRRGCPTPTTDPFLYRRPVDPPPTTHTP